MTTILQPKLAKLKLKYQSKLISDINRNLIVETQNVVNENTNHFRGISCNKIQRNQMLRFTAGSISGNGRLPPLLPPPTRTEILAFSIGALFPSKAAIGHATDNALAYPIHFVHLLRRTEIFITCRGSGIGLMIALVNSSTDSFTRHSFL